jgi:hypothetical protein
MLQPLVIPCDVTVARPCGYQPAEHQAGKLVFPSAAALGMRLEG